MKTEERFIKHYKDGYIPWAHANPDFNLVETIREWKIKPCKTLEVGCGTGTDAIWLSNQKFDVTAIDVSPVAIKLAEKNSAASNSNCRFLVKDFLEYNPDEKQFEFIFDRGYFHSFKTTSRRRRIAKHIAQHLKNNGLWLSLIGSCDSPPRETGPPMLSAKNIIDSVEKHFEIQFIKSSVFGNDQAQPAKNWVCLMKKRKS